MHLPTTRVPGGCQPFSLTPRLQRISTGRGRLAICAGQVSSNDFKNGMTVEIDGSPFRIVVRQCGTFYAASVASQVPPLLHQALLHTHCKLKAVIGGTGMMASVTAEFLHVKPGKGAAFVRSKLKNYLTGNTVERTFRAGEMVDTAVVERNDSEFTYEDGEDYVFMNMNSYEETRVRKDDSWAKYLKEGMEVGIVSWNGKVISVDVPNTVELVVAETEPGVKGNTVQGGSKPATLETGAVIQVPMFITSGEKIKVDTRSDEYLGRVND